MTTTDTNQTRSVFKGYYAALTNDQGQTSKCYVINARESMVFNDGTSGPALKVRPIHRYLSGGWSGGGGSFSEKTLAPIWVRASRVST